MMGTLWATGYSVASVHRALRRARLAREVAS